MGQSPLTQSNEQHQGLILTCNIIYTDWLLFYYLFLFYLIIFYHTPKDCQGHHRCAQFYPSYPR